MKNRPLSTGPEVYFSMTNGLSISKHISSMPGVEKMCFCPVIFIASSTE